MTSTQEQIVFKILARAEWQAAVSAGAYTGSADDARDGFIHLSTAAQLAGTASKHFKGKPGLVLVALDTTRLGGRLAWEPSRGGELFPHLYGALDPKAATAVHDLPLGPDGVPAIPHGVAR